MCCAHPPSMVKNWSLGHGAEPVTAHLWLGPDDSNDWMTDCNSCFKENIAAVTNHSRLLFMSCERIVFRCLVNWSVLVVFIFLFKWVNNRCNKGQTIPCWNRSMPSADDRFQINEKVYRSTMKWNVRRKRISAEGFVNTPSLRDYCRNRSVVLLFHRLIESKSSSTN